MTLLDCALKFGVDKLHSHTYIPLYTELFKDRHIETLLEVGIGYEQLQRAFVPFYIHGASLKMWRDWLPEARIYGCDIRPETLFSDERIYTALCDQSDPRQLQFMADALGPWDVVVDDGSHLTKDQILTAHILLPYTKQLYIIEDVQQPEEIVSVIQCGQIVRFNKRPDDCLVVIQK